MVTLIKGLLSWIVYWTSILASESNIIVFPYFSLKLWFSRSVSFSIIIYDLCWSPSAMDIALLIRVELIVLLGRYGITIRKTVTVKLDQYIAITCFEVLQRTYILLWINLNCYVVTSTETSSIRQRKVDLGKMRSTVLFLEESWVLNGNCSSFLSFVIGRCKTNEGDWIGCF